MEAAPSGVLRPVLLAVANEFGLRDGLPFIEGLIRTIEVGLAANLADADLPPGLPIDYQIVILWAADEACLGHDFEFEISFHAPDGQPIDQRVYPFRPTERNANCTIRADGFPIRGSGWHELRLRTRRAGEHEWGDYALCYTVDVRLLVDGTLAYSGAGTPAASS